MPFEAFKIYMCACVLCLNPKGSVGGPSKANYTDDF